IEEGIGGIAGDRAIMPVALLFRIEDPGQGDARVGTGVGAKAVREQQRIPERAEADGELLRMQLALKISEHVAGRGTNDPGARQRVQSPGRSWFVFFVVRLD